MRWRFLEIQTGIFRLMESALNIPEHPSVRSFYPLAATSTSPPPQIQFPVLPSSNSKAKNKVVEKMSVNNVAKVQRITH